MGARDVGGILQRGGTVLQTRRSDAFKEPAGQQKAILKLKEAGIDALVVIDSDKVWADKSSWVWKKQPILANDYARAFLCGRGVAS